jgi:DNA-binding HxlR family transcriptional regulator
MQKYSYRETKVSPAAMAEQMSECPTQIAMEIIGGKWPLIILYHLADGHPKRYKQIENLIGTISPKMLIKELKNLESYQIIHRKQYNTIPPMVEYSLTDFGKELLPVLEAVFSFGTKLLAKKK